MRPHFFNGVAYDTSNFPREVYIEPIQNGPFDGDEVSTIIREAFQPLTVESIEFEEPRLLYWGHLKYVVAKVTTVSPPEDIEKLDNELANVNESDDYWMFANNFADRNGPLNGKWVTHIKVDIAEAFDLDDELSNRKKVST